MAKIIEKIKNFFRIINLEKERIEKEKRYAKRKDKNIFGNSRKRK